MVQYVVFIYLPVVFLTPVWLSDGRDSWAADRGEFTIFTATSKHVLLIIINNNF